MRLVTWHGMAGKSFAQGPTAERQPLRCARHSPGGCGGWRWPRRRAADAPPPPCEATPLLPADPRVTAALHLHRRHNVVRILHLRRIRQHPRTLMTMPPPPPPPPPLTPPLAPPTRRRRTPPRCWSTGSCRRAARGSRQAPALLAPLQVVAALDAPRVEAPDALLCRFCCSSSCRRCLCLLRRWWSGLPQLAAVVAGCGGRVMRAEATLAWRPLAWTTSRPVRASRCATTARGVRRTRDGPCCESGRTHACKRRKRWRGRRLSAEGSSSHRHYHHHRRRRSPAAVALVRGSVMTNPP